MRIAIIAPPWVPVPPPAYGGTESMLDLLARGLQDRGHDVLLYTTGDSTCAVPRVRPRARVRRAGQHCRRAAPCDPCVLGGAERRHRPRPYARGPVYSARFPDLPVVTTNHGPFDEELNDIYRARAGMVPVIAISHAHAASVRRIREHVTRRQRDRERRTFDQGQTPPAVCREVLAVIVHGCDMVDNATAVSSFGRPGPPALLRSDPQPKLSRANDRRWVMTAVERTRRNGVQGEGGRSRGGAG